MKEKGEKGCVWDVYEYPGGASLVYEGYLSE